MSQAISVVPHPKAAVWLLRLAADPALSLVLRLDAVAFAGWYAVVGDALDWPQPVRDIVTAERARKLTLEQSIKLLEQVNYTMAGRVSAGHARRVLEGYAVHEWVGENFRAFGELAARELETVARAANSPHVSLSPFAQRVNELARVLGLSELETDILAFAFLTAASDEICGIFEQLMGERWAAERLWPVVFGASAETLARALRPRSALRLSGLLRPAGRRAQLASVSPFWLELLARADSLFEAVLEPVREAAGSGMPARLAPEDQALAVQLLTAAREPGVNLLLYGAPNLDKRHLLQDVVARAGRRAWRVRSFEDAWRSDAASLTYVAFALLADHADDAALVIERPAEVLTANVSEFLQALFGVTLEREGIEPFDEHLLAHNGVPGIWLLGATAALPDETMARFVFHAPLKAATREEREARLRERLHSLKLTKAAMAELLRLDGVSAAQLEAALKAARLTGAVNRKARDAALVQAVRRSQRALARDLRAGTRESVTQYSLKYLNTAGRFGPVEVLECFRRNPRGTLVLYGPPGTGKTQFVEFMASELRVPLLTRRASELLNKYVGESEKNIARAFEEATQTDSMLFLDEGDSFLRERSRAQHSWEVTQVNELLQHMERFDGIFVVSTNLFRGLDAAALRRFTFKVEFRALTAEQRWEMFLNEAGLRGRLGEYPRSVRESWETRLALMRELAPGDFATVKRQSLLLGVALSPDEWLEQLQVECDVKTGGQG